MNININKIVFGFTLILIFGSCNPKNKNNSHDYHWSEPTNLNDKEKEQKLVWDKFKNSVLSKDFESFKQLSQGCIYSSEYIPENPSGESSVPTEIFIRQYFNDIFDSNANSFYFDDKNIGWISVEDSSDAHSYDCITDGKPTVNSLEVSIHNRSCRGEECSQTIFIFTNKGAGFKFNGILYLP